MNLKTVHKMFHELLLDHFGVDYRVDFQTTNEPKSVFTDFIKVRREELKNVKKCKCTCKLINIVVSALSHLRY